MHGGPGGMGGPGRGPGGMGGPGMGPRPPMGPMMPRRGCMGRGCGCGPFAIVLFIGVILVGVFI